MVIPPEVIAVNAGHQEEKLTTNRYTDLAFAIRILHAHHNTAELEQQSWGRLMSGYPHEYQTSLARTVQGPADPVVSLLDGAITLTIFHTAGRAIVRKHRKRTMSGEIDRGQLQG